MFICVQIYQLTLVFNELFPIMVKLSNTMNFIDVYYALHAQMSTMHCRDVDYALQRCLLCNAQIMYFIDVYYAMHRLCISQMSTMQCTDYVFYRYRCINYALQRCLLCISQMSTMQFYFIDINYAMHRCLQYLAAHLCADFYQLTQVSNELFPMVKLSNFVYD